MSKFLFGLILGIALLLVVEYLFVAHGGLYMGTNGDRLPMEQHLANKAIAASIGQSAREESPVPADETNLLAGAHIYQQGCAGCHGRLDQDPATHVEAVLPAAAAAASSRQRRRPTTPSARHIGW